MNRLDELLREYNTTFKLYYHTQDVVIKNRFKEEMDRLQREIDIELKPSIYQNVFEGVFG